MSRRIVMNMFMLSIGLLLLVMPASAKQEQSSDSSQTYLKKVSYRICSKEQNLEFQKQSSIAGRYILSEEAIRIFLIQTFNNGFGSALFSNGQICVYFLCVILVFLSLLIIWLKLLEVCKKYLSRVKKIEQFQINRRLVIGIQFISFICLIFSSYGMNLSEKIGPALNRSICSYLSANENIANASILIKEGETKHQFDEDFLNFQFRLSQAEQEAAKILKSNGILFKQKMQKQSFNFLTKPTYFHNYRNFLYQNHSNILNKLKIFINSTNQISIFLNYFREKLIQNREALIRYIWSLDFLFNIEQLPNSIQFWFKTFFMLGLLESLIVSTFFIILLKKKWQFRFFLQKIMISKLFGMWLLIFIFFILFAAENVLQANCFIHRDIHDKNLFQQYYRLYNQRQQPLLRQYVRKKQKHEKESFQQFYGLNIKNLIVNISKDLNKIQDQIFQSSQNASIFNNNTTNQQFIILKQIRQHNQIENTQFIESNNQFIKKLRGIYQQKNQVTQRSIQQYNIGEIGQYQKKFLFQTCQIDLSILIQINSVILTLIIISIISSWLIYHVIKLEQSMPFIRIQSQMKVEESQHNQTYSYF